MIEWISRYRRREPMRSAAPGLMMRAIIAWLLLKMIRRQIAIKCQMGVLEHDGATQVSVERVVRPRSLKDLILAPGRKPFSFLRFIRRMLECDRRLISACLIALNCEKLSGREVVLYGNEEAARVLSILARQLPVRIHAICQPEPGPDATLCGGPRLWSEEQLRAWSGTVIVSAFVNIEARIRRLRELGVPSERVHVIQAVHGTNGHTDSRHT